MGGQRQAQARGLILVDTKYELGFTKDGRRDLLVIDEVLAVLLHELGHVRSRHGTRMLLQGKA